jgi:hypothetical protein
MKFFKSKKRKPLEGLLDGIFGYTTVREASIKSIKVGVTYRIVQIIILFYIIGYFLLKFDKNE